VAPYGATARTAHGTAGAYRRQLNRLRRFFRGRTPAYGGLAGVRLEKERTLKTVSPQKMQERLDPLSVSLLQRVCGYAKLRDANALLSPVSPRERV